MMSIGTILIMVLLVFLLGGFAGVGGRPFYGAGPVYGGGGIGLLLLVVLILLLLGHL